jgi:hypothetical protein
MAGSGIVNVGSPDWLVPGLVLAMLHPKHQSVTPESPLGLPEGRTEREGALLPTLVEASLYEREATIRCTRRLPWVSTIVAVPRIEGMLSGVSVQHFELRVHYLSDGMQRSRRGTDLIEDADLANRPR